MSATLKRLGRTVQDRPRYTVVRDRGKVDRDMTTGTACWSAWCVCL